MDRADKLLYGSGLGMIAGLVLAARMRSSAAGTSGQAAPWGDSLLLGLAGSSGYMLAAKALLVSSILSGASLGLAVAGVAKYLQVSTFREFGVLARRHLEGLAPPVPSRPPPAALEGQPITNLEGSNGRGKIERQ